MKKLLFLLLVLYVFVGDFDGKTVIASASTDVSGIIREDTVWTKENSPYNLVGDIQIANGVTLKIEPGTMVNGNNRGIYNLGILEVIGNSNSRIKISNTHIVPANDEYSKKCLIHIEYTDIISGSLYGAKGITGYGSLILKDSRIFGLSEFMYLWYPNNNVYIERNVFMNSHKISVGTSGDTKVYIRNNIFYNSLGNTIENWNSSGSSETIVEFNSFLGFGNALILPNGYRNTKITAVNNYWGTVDETSIGQMIFDKNDDLRAASVIEFKPYLTEPDSNTPTIDVTAPEKPTVDEMTEKSLFITGTAEKRSTISFFLGLNNQNYSFGKTIADDYGNFKFPINTFPPNTVISVVATDDWYNNSESTSVTVKDVTAPLVPIVSEVTDQTTVISGTTEAGAVILVHVGLTEIGQTIAGKDGAFKVMIPKQVAGTDLTITATDDAGNISPAVTVLVADKTAPALRVNQITNRSGLITGMTESKAKVQLTYATKIIETTADATGNFSFTITKPNTNEEFSFTASDSLGNKSEVLKLKVIDATLPVIKGATDITIEAGMLFDKKLNVTAMDETDGNLTKSMLIYGIVDSKKPGIYSLTYSARDRARNHARIIRRVTVKDTIKPVLSGVMNQSINLNSTFDPKKGITAKDNIDGDVTKNIQVSGSVNLKKVGTYTLTYKVADRSGNTTTLIRKITVKDNVKPVITGAKSKTVKYKSSFNPMTGVTAKDNVDGSLTKSIKVTGSVNTKRKGIYALTYTVKDKAGNSTSVKIKITVR